MEIIIETGKVEDDGLSGEMKAVESEIAESERKLKEIKASLLNFASESDFNKWATQNLILKKATDELGWLTAKKEGLQFKLKKADRADKEKKAELRQKALVALCDSKKAIRSRFDRIATNLVQLLKDNTKLHNQSVEDLPVKSEQELMVFKPETDFQHFFLVLNSHNEASDFLKMANRMTYPAVDGKRKMKDYYHDLVE